MCSHLSTTASRSSQAEGGGGEGTEETGGRRATQVRILRVTCCHPFLSFIDQMALEGMKTSSFEPLGGVRDVATQRCENATDDSLVVLTFAGRVWRAVM